MRVLSALLLLPALAVFAFVVTAPPTPSGVAYVTAVLVFTAAGLARDADQRRLGRRVACGLLATTVAWRLLSVDGGADRGVRMSTPDATTARWIDRVIAEEDLSVNAARALALTHVIHDPDVPALARAMRGAYGRMAYEVGTTPSPVLATYTGLEAPGADDTLEIGDVARSEGALVFLHGFAGSFTLPCWLVSRGAAAAGFATVCPSTRWVGDWWTADGEATLRETLRTLRQRGVRRVVLAGLSNGGIGASLLAPRLAGAGALDGLILISGASPEASPPGVPVLALQGEHDAQISAEVVRAYADRVHGRYVPLDAGHFAMLLHEAEVTRAVTAFLLALPKRPVAAATARRELL